MTESLGKRIAENRKRLKLTQDQLAEKLGVTAQAVSKWENDQSCPDIGTLPAIADIFGITTDELLGRSAKDRVYEAQIVEPDDECEQSNIKAGWELHWEPGRIGALGLAVLVLLVGSLYLLSALLLWDLSLWEILWPSSLLVFGLFSLFKSFSFFSLGCFALGSFFLTDKLFSFDLPDNSKFIWAVIIVLFGCSLLIDALRKRNLPWLCWTHGKKGKKSNNKQSTRNYSCAENRFTYTATFSEDRHTIDIERLEHGDISVAFGEYTIDLSHVEDVLTGCALDVNCSFGELTLLIPSKYIVKQETSSVLASIKTEGQPDASAEKEIMLDASANFGEIVIRYI